MNRTREVKNRQAVEMALQAADKFNVAYVVFHPEGIERAREDECSFDNLTRLMREYSDSRLLLEVVPTVLDYDGRPIFPAWHIDSYKRMQDMTGKGILLDTGHATINARTFRIPAVEYMQGLIDGLGIKHIHISDTDARDDGYMDLHLNIGAGDVPNREILRANQDKIEYALIEVSPVTPEDISAVKSYII